ncbi:hypothetical protein M758_3G042900 [Ceratodon purpureus]|uniref:Armadillo repeat-containing protein 7 n=1 Tax=Ceratodon purpureus TaxID=3225 RepID=A0A8T0IGT4_CERPU|nr:hypothetical protein KC19_3G044200 [Ceratodon purpureus]KAG0621711.1 hypothetical protein M758_3G042900 [Ceratodon purpureus]
MFSNAFRQKERTGKYGSARDQYLQDLVTEFQQTVHEEAKEQVVAHLANFAYDPFNFGFLRTLNVLDLFLDCLTESNEKLVEYALGGICNCVADSTNAAIVVENGGIPQIIQCLSSPVENTVLSAIATLYYLCTPATKKDILKPDVLEYMNKYANTGGVNIRFSNLAQSFLDTHVHRS